MKNIVSIFTSDIRRIVKNRSALIIVIGLAFLPSLYAWFNILSSWDPYGNTDAIKIAVVNQDKGSSINGESFNIGNDIVHSLKNNEQMGWTFVTEEEATHGVEHGDYYASILIDEDFSEKISTVITDDPVKPEVIYTVNEKINAIAPKITSSGVSSLVEIISSNFVKEANKVIFKTFNDLGIELEENLPTIEKIFNFIFEIEKEFPKIIEDVNKGSQKIDEYQQIVSDMNEHLDEVNAVLGNYYSTAVDLNEKVTKYEDWFNTISGSLNINYETLNSYLQESQSFLEQMESGELPIEELTAKKEEQMEGITSKISTIEQTVSILEAVQNWSNTSLFQEEIDQLQSLNTLLTMQLQTLESLEGQLTEENLKDFMDNEQKIKPIIQELSDNFDETTLKDLESAFQKGTETADKMMDYLQTGKELVPQAEERLGSAQQQLNALDKQLTTIEEELPYYQESLQSIADKIRTFQAEYDLLEIIELLKNNYEEESDYFANPILLKENKLFPIPNYGSAMSPFFTTLSLWVGGLILVSVLTVEVHVERRMKAGEVYFGRLFTFLTIAIMQAVIVSLGDIFLLKTYVVDKFWFVIFSIFISLVFMTIIYTLVSVFGNIGKALSIILLVLQLASSGGTFPVQLVPKVFQYFHPLMPFTYAISMMREAVGGILWGVVIEDLLYLSIFPTIMILMGIFLKKPINKHTRKMIKKARESRLMA
ncbi:YhgE/Pip domain-containing protein [Bacillus carboniphilus]|uniref:YhgE/Pip domain-containing protein n=1 Tax=Bacillus carboniphilus TaxID=86663 RepID=A0ABY9JTF7_9BACI|nr:YhgE/Pip domain-containing protein [Bacillus carboniphilus]WLR41788.1 YhgE/Pip domain-containing protein [Bacillus carboniphilus]